MSVTSNIVKTYANVRGSLTENAPLAPYTWFRTGGSADLLFRPKDQEDLRLFLRETPPETPIHLLGAASNLLIRDGGVDGTVIKLGKEFGEIKKLDDQQVEVGAAVPDLNFSIFLANNGLTGGEFFRGVPGTIGGALRMNAGAYGSETAQCVRQIKAMKRNGEIVEFTEKEADFHYRRCGLSEDLIFLSAIMAFQPGDPEKIRNRMDEITQNRGATQPVKSRTGGSTFKNPEGDKAWRLIDAAGCRGLKIGGASVSELHCNFLINEDNASAADLENLGETVRGRVYDLSGIILEWEIKRIGRFGAEPVRRFSPTEIKNNDTEIVNVTNNRKN